MKTQPYYPLYVQDLLTHPGLTRCSSSTCGVYFFLLCVLHKQNEGGVYRVFDAPQGDPVVYFAAALRRQTPFDPDEIERALRELLRYGVLAIEDKCLIDKDMRDRFALSAKRAEAGKMGGKQAQRKRAKAASASDFASAKSQANAENENDIDIDIENEERIKGVQGEKGEDNGFETLWSHYPRKTEKAAARKAYLARLRDGWSPPELIAAAQAYAAQCRAEKREQRFIKHGAVFLGASTPFADYIPKEPCGEDENDDLKECF